MANGKQIYLRSQQIDENGFLRTLAGVAIKAAPAIVRSGGLINSRGGLNQDAAGSLVSGIGSAVDKTQRIQGIQQAKEKAAAEKAAADKKAAEEAAAAEKANQEQARQAKSDARVAEVQSIDRAKEDATKFGRETVNLVPGKPTGIMPQIKVDNKPTIQQKYKATVRSTLLTPPNPDDVTGRI
jgi:hypothetical protein